MQTERQSEMTKLIVAFRNFVNARKKPAHGLNLLRASKFSFVNHPSTMIHVHSSTEWRRDNRSATGRSSQNKERFPTIIIIIIIIQDGR